MDERKDPQNIPDKNCIEVREFLNTAPGPIPWYSPKYLKYKNSQTTWNPIKDNPRKISLNNNNQPIVIAEMYSVIYTLNSSKIILANDNSSNLNLILINLNSIEYIQNLQEACNLMDSSHSSYFINGFTEENILIPYNLKKGKNKFEFSQKFKAIPNIIVVLHKWGSAIEKVAYKTAAYELQFNQNNILVIPQDWFNNGDFDFEYQWITQIARFPQNNRLYGEGFRLGIFKLNEEGNSVESWCISDPFYGRYN